MTLIRIYNAVVLPHFNYCSNVWNDGTNSLLNKWYKLEKRAARVINRSNYYIPSSDIFKRLRWDAISKILLERQLIVMFKITKDFVPNYLSELFNLRDNPQNSLRNNKIEYSLTEPHTSFLKDAFRIEDLGHGTRYQTFFFRKKLIIQWHLSKRK